MFQCLPSHVMISLPGLKKGRSLPNIDGVGCPSPPVTGDEGTDGAEPLRGEEAGGGEGESGTCANRQRQALAHAIVPQRNCFILSSSRTPSECPCRQLRS